jgi:ABC-type transport system substrate-binding protein
MKWIFFGYLMLCILVVAAIAVSFAITRDRDPYTNYTSYGGDIKTLDPAEIGDEASGTIAGDVFECLYNYKYGAPKYELEPELADGNPVNSPDGRTMTIRIKPGIHFYDPEKAVFSDGVGPEVTADDFVYSWKRVCNFHLEVTVNYGQMFQGHIVGIDDWFAYTQSCKSAADIDWNRPVEGLKALDRYTLQVKLVDPFPQFQFNLAMVPTAPVCRKAVEFYGDHFKDHPIGTGPYYIEQNLKEQQIVMQANPLFRGGNDVPSNNTLPADQRLPYVKRIQFNLFQDDLSRWFIFLQGLLDANDIPKDTFNQAIHISSGELTDEMKQQGIKLTKDPSPEVLYTGFNMADPVVGKNKALRQAISLAYDRQKFIDLYLNGRGLAANGPIPPGFPTFEANRKAEFCRFDLDAARAKLKEAEAFNGGPIPTLHILFGDTTTATTQEGDFFVTQMKMIGLTVEAEYKPWPRFLQMVDEKQAQIFDLGWVADYPDEQDFWQLFCTKYAGPGGLNSCNYSNPTFDALYDKSSVMSASPERDAIYKQMQDIVLDECPWVFKLYPVGYGLYHNWENDSKPMDYGYGFKSRLQIDFKARSQWLKSH